MLMYKTTVAPSRIHGLGCFAAEPIPKGSAVWIYESSWDVLCATDLPPAAKIYSLNHGFPTPEGWLMPGDNARYINHSEHPLLCGGPGTETFYAVRDILPGEELVEDYRQFNIQLNF